MKDVAQSNTFKTTITATLSVRDWARAVEFYMTAFGATELSVQGAPFWVAEESPENQNFSPQALGGCSVRMLLIVPDPRAVCKQAVDAGATLVVPVAEAYGWLLGRIMDPFGHHWEIARQLT
jgi:PhnB protein